MHVVKKPLETFEIGNFNMKLIIKYFDEKTKRRKQRIYDIYSLDFHTWPKQALMLIDSLSNVIESIYYVQYDINDFKRLESG